MLNLRCLRTIAILFCSVILVAKVFAVSSSDWDRRTNGFDFTTYGWSNPLPDILTRTLQQPFFSGHYINSSEHLGADLMAPAGTAVYSPCDGVIIDAKDFTYWRSNGRDNPDSYLNSRVLIRCTHSLGDFMSVQMHVDNALKSAGASVKAGEQVAELTKTYDPTTGVRTPGNDHLHFGINSNPNFVPPVSVGAITFKGYGVAPSGATVTQANTAGFYDPFSFLSTRIGAGIKATFHGAGSLINPASVGTSACASIGGWGCYRDEVRLHADGSVPLGVFQVGYSSANCTSVDVEAEELYGGARALLPVTIRMGGWSSRSSDVEYRATLPTTVPLEVSSWNVLAISLQNAVSAPKRLKVTCRVGSGQITSPGARLQPSDPRGVALSNGYYWTGNGSVITASGGSIQTPFGYTQDWAKMSSFSANGVGGTFFQWYRSASCPRVRLTANWQTGNFRIRYRSWDTAPSGTLAYDNVYLGEVAGFDFSPTADGYYLIYVYPQQSATTSAVLHDLRLVCM